MIRVVGYSALFDEARLGYVAAVVYSCALLCILIHGFYLVGSIFAILLSLLLHLANAVHVLLLVGGLLLH